MFWGGGMALSPSGEEDTRISFIPLGARIIMSVHPNASGAGAWCKSHHLHAVTLIKGGN